MAVPAPNVTQNIQEGQLGAIALGTGRLLAILGCSSAGPVNSPRRFAGGQVQKIVDTFGDGPGVELVSLIVKAGRSAVFVRMPSTTAGDQGTDGEDGEVTFTGTGTSVITLTGAALDFHEGLFEVIAGGARGTPGITFRYSLDAGRTWSAVTELGAATTYAIPRSGVTLNFAAGTLVAGDTATWIGKEPEWASTDLDEAYAALVASSHNVRGIGVAGPASSAEATAMKTELVGGEGAHRYQFVILEARGQDLDGTEDEDEWMAAIITEFAAFSSTRVGIGAGKLWILSPISQRQLLRPLSWAAIARAAGVPIHRDLGRVKDGPLDAQIVDSNGVLIGHDERVNPGLNEARFITATTKVGKVGVYITNPMLMAPPGSDFELLQYRAVMDEGCAITYDKLSDYESDEVRVAKNGKVLEKDAKAIESAITGALHEALVKPGHVSAARFVLSREDDILGTKKIQGQTRIRPLGYIKEIVNDIGFENPNVVVVG